MTPQVVLDLGCIDAVIPLRREGVGVFVAVAAVAGELDHRQVPVRVDLQSRYLTEMSRGCRLWISRVIRDATVEDFVGKAGSKGVRISPTLRT